MSLLLTNSRRLIKQAGGGGGEADRDQSVSSPWQALGGGLVKPIDEFLQVRRFLSLLFFAEHLGFFLQGGQAVVSVLSVRRSRFEDSLRQRRGFVSEHAITPGKAQQGVTFVEEMYQRCTNKFRLESR